MEDILANKLYELVDLIKETEEYKKVKELDELMSKDINVLTISNLLKSEVNEYNSLILKNIDSNEKIKRISELKSKLYSLEIVKKYNKAYNKLKSMLEEINTLVNKGVINESNRR